MKQCALRVDNARARCVQTARGRRPVCECGCGKRSGGTELGARWYYGELVVRGDGSDWNPICQNIHGMSRRLPIQVASALPCLTLIPRSDLDQGMVHLCTPEAGCVLCDREHGARRGRAVNAARALHARHRAWRDRGWALCADALLRASDGRRAPRAGECPEGPQGRQARPA